MSNRPPANRLRGLALVTALAVVSSFRPGESRAASEPEKAALRPDSAAIGTDKVAQAAASPYETLIARVFVNTVNRGDLAILRDTQGKVLVPVAEFDKWGLSVGEVVPISVRGERFVPLSELREVDVRFDPKTVTLELQVAAKALPATLVNLGPQHRGGVIYPSDNSFFLN